jgi:hypothetical protein
LGGKILAFKLRGGAPFGIEKADGHSQVANLLCRYDLAASVATLPVYQ